MQRLGGVPDIPLPELFFSGGASTNRAFPDNQAGPRDTKTGFPLEARRSCSIRWSFGFP